MKDKNIDIQTIQSAKNGDFEAMEKILKHYEGLINRLSSRPCVEDSKKNYRVTDTFLRDRIISKLMYQIIYKYEVGGKTEKE